MKPTPISEVLRRIRPLSREHKMDVLRSYIASEQGDNVHRTSVRIREFQAALKVIVNQDLKAYVRQAKKERAA